MRRPLRAIESLSQQHRVKIDNEGGKLHGRIRQLKGKVP